MKRGADITETDGVSRSSAERTRSRPEPSQAGEVLFERFEVLSELGVGAFGRVVHCFDHQTQSEVALKELHRFGADSLLRFKNEFRALSDAHHPNLVRLGELLQGEAGDWAFTMELVPGSDVLTWMRMGGAPGHFDEERVRSVLAQLASGLHALHSLGLLHRDVKAENVRVTPDGRVVLLDFGLVSHLSAGPQTTEAGALGTVAYMAPEQMDGQVGPPADFYALGVLLHEALTGRLPFEGAAVRMMLAKSEGPAPSPRDHNPAVPADLDGLCQRLLQPDPERRPRVQQILEVVGHPPQPVSTQLSSMSVSRLFGNGGSFVGRRRELRLLEDQWHQARADGLRVVTLEGQSGIGKTALMEEFARGMRERQPELLVLRSRCHPAELLRFKLWDGIVDALCKHLRSIKEEECQALLPPRPELLAMLFPVLGRVKGVPLATSRARGVDAAAERFAAFSEFGVLLERLAESRPLVICVDDVQWGDRDSLAVLQAMFALRQSPRTLIVATMRPAAELEPDLHEKLQELRKLHERFVDIRLEGLSDGEMQRLSAQLTGLDLHHDILKRVVRQTQGHPWLATELAHHLERLPDDSGDSTDLDAALRDRVRELGPAATSVMQLLAISGGPQPTPVVREALDLDAEELQRTLASLRANKLVGAARRGSWICYHDRIRQAMASAVSEHQARAIHAQLARTWATREGDPLRVAGHFQAAGDDFGALPWLAQAAEHAAASGAFERAAELHAAVLEGRKRADAPPEELHELRSKLAEALAAAGRCGASAHVLLSMLEHAENDVERAELRVRAAERLLQAGKVPEGVEAAREAFESLEMAWPRSSRTAVLRMRWNRLCLALQGTTLRVRSGEGNPRVQAELDTMWRFAPPLLWVDLPRYGELVSRHLRLALRTGDPKHGAFALLGVAAAAIGMGNLERGNELLAQAKPLVEHVAAPELSAYLEYVMASCAIFQGDHQRAQGLLQRAERRYLEDCPAEAWMRTNVRTSQLTGWWSRGEFDRYRTHAEAWIIEARLREDAYAESSFCARGFGCMRHCMNDRPDRALDELDRVSTPWNQANNGLQWGIGLIARHQVLRYRMDGATAQHWQRYWPQVRRSVIMRVGYIADLVQASRLAGALETCGEPGADPQRLRALKSLAKTADSPRTVLGRGHLDVLYAQVHLLLGENDQALARLRQSRNALEASAHGFSRAAHVLEVHCTDPRNARHAEAEQLDWYRDQGWLRPEMALQLFGLPIHQWLRAAWRKL